MIEKLIQNLLTSWVKGIIFCCRKPADFSLRKETKFTGIENQLISIRHWKRNPVKDKKKIFLKLFNLWNLTSLVLFGKVDGKEYSFYESKLSSGLKKVLLQNVFLYFTDNSLLCTLSASLHCNIYLKIVHSMHSLEM